MPLLVHVFLNIYSSLFFVLSGRYTVLIVPYGQHNFCYYTFLILVVYSSLFHYANCIVGYSYVIVLVVFFLFIMYHAPQPSWCVYCLLFVVCCIVC